MTDGKGLQLYYSIPARTYYLAVCLLISKKSVSVHSVVTFSVVTFILSLKSGCGYSINR